MEHASAQHAAAAAELIAARASFAAAHEKKDAAAAALVAAAEKEKVMGQQAADAAQAAMAQILGKYAPRLDEHGIDKADIGGAFEPPELVPASAYSQLLAEDLAARRAAFIQLVEEAPNASQRELRMSLKQLNSSLIRAPENARAAASEMLDLELVSEPDLLVTKRALLFAEHKRIWESTGPWRTLHRDIRATFSESQALERRAVGRLNVDQEEDEEEGDEEEEDEEEEDEEKEDEEEEDGKEENEEEEDKEEDEDSKEGLLVDTDVAAKAPAKRAAGQQPAAEKRRRVER